VDGDPTPIAKSCIWYWTLKIMIGLWLQELLKTHLMFAVREEIEQLKEQISDLTDRNAQLEYENKLLKARASRETLALLNSALSVDD